MIASWIYGYASALGGAGTIECQDKICNTNRFSEDFVIGLR